MSWRVVLVSSNAKLDYKLDYLVVRTLDEVKRIHLSEIAVLILESTAISITSYLLLSSPIYWQEGRIPVMAVEYPLSFAEGEYVQPLLKALKCQPVLDSPNPLERIMQYCEIYSGLMKDQCFVLVSANSYFSKQELSELYRMAAYKKWRLLLLEAGMPERLTGEDICLIDKDLCELRLDSPPEMS